MIVKLYRTEDIELPTDRSILNVADCGKEGWHPLMLDATIPLLEDKTEVKSYPIHTLVLEMGGHRSEEKCVIMDDDALIDKFLRYAKREIWFRTQSYQRIWERYHSLQLTIRRASFSKRLKYLFTKKI